MVAHRNFGNPKYIDGDFATGVSAAGTTQSDATTLPANHCLVETVAAGAGVVVPALPDGEVFSVANGQGVNALLVYPPSGASFNNTTANTAVSIPTNMACYGRFVSSTDIILIY